MLVLVLQLVDLRFLEFPLYHPDGVLARVETVEKQVLSVHFRVDLHVLDGWRTLENLVVLRQRVVTYLKGRELLFLVVEDYHFVVFVVAVVVVVVVVMMLLLLLLGLRKGRRMLLRCRGRGRRR